MSARIYHIDNHPKRRPMPMDALLALARRFAAGAAIPAEDEGYRRQVLARCCGAVTELLDD